MSIAIFGGNGFLGRKLCEYGIRNGFKVTSFSRTGVPPITTNEYLKQVNWEAANIFDDSSYKPKLSQFNTVIHSMGKVFEDESYKTNLSSLVIDLGAIKNILLGANPMNKTIYNSIEAINKISALKLASAYSKANKHGKFVYISADKGLPIAPTDYIRTKREAEVELLSSKLDTLIVRPGVMYDEHEQNNRYFFVNGLKRIHETKSLVLGESLECANTLIRPVMSTDEVSRSIYKHLDEKNMIISLKDLAG